MITEQTSRNHVEALISERAAHNHTALKPLPRTPCLIVITTTLTQSWVRDRSLKGRCGTLETESGTHQRKE